MKSAPGRAAPRGKKAAEAPRPKPFFQRVYDVVATIPRGKVMTYGQIARRLGGFPTGRSVGYAMAAAPAERKLPCHRVVNAKGEMAPGLVFGGAEAQRRLLEKEGVPFRPDGRIDLPAALAE